MADVLLVLTLAALLQVGQMGAYAVTANLQIPPGTALGPRDTPVQLTGTAGRLQRAMNNHFEGLLLFAIACAVLTISDKASAFTNTCAWIYLAARVAYIPAYVFGLSPWRSLIWLIGFAATSAMLIAALF